MSDDDRLWTGRLLERLTEEHFKERLGKLLGAAGDSDADLLAGLRSLVFGDFMVPGAGEGCRRCCTCIISTCFHKMLPS